MDEVRQIQDDAVSSNDLNSGSLLNNLVHWDVGNITTNAFSEIYAQEGDDDVVLPFEALLDSKSNDAINNNNETPWIDGSSSSCDNMGTSLACVERDDFQILHGLDVVETSNSSKYILGTTSSMDNVPLTSTMKEKSLLSENSDYSTKVPPEVNSSAHVIFLNTAKQSDKTPQFDVTVSRTTFENCVKNIKNNFINEMTCFDQSRQDTLFGLDVEGIDMIQKSFESNGTVGGNLSIADALCMDGTQDVFGADESSNSFLDESNHSTAESSNLQTQYTNQLVYADLSVTATKDSNFQNNSTLFLNSLQIPKQHLVISSEGQQKIILQSQSKPQLLKQLSQQPSLSLNQHFILHQTPNQVVSPQLHNVFQHLKMPQQIIRTTFQQNLLENTNNLLSGHLALNKLTVEEQQGSNIMIGNIKSVKPPRNRNQVNRSGRTDTAVGGKPNATGPTNEKDSQELERVMNILKHYKQQIASNDQESQFLPCKRKRSKPPENVVNCTSATNSINNLPQSKLVTSAVIPNLNLSFNLSIKSNDSKSENLIGNPSVKASFDFGSLMASSSEQLNVLTASSPTTKALATSLAQTTSTLLPPQTNVTSTRSFLSPQCSQNFPFSLQVPVSNALSRNQSLLSSLQNSTPTTLQLSIKNLTKLVGLSSVSSPNVDIMQTNENTKVLKSAPSTTTGSQNQTSQQQVLNVSQALITLHQLNSNQKLSNSQQILISSLLQKNLPQFLQLSVRQNSSVPVQTSLAHSVSQIFDDTSINLINASTSDQTLQIYRSVNSSSSDSTKHSKVATQLFASNSTNSTTINLQVHSVGQGQKNDADVCADWDLDETPELLTGHPVTTSYTNPQTKTRAGDLKLAPIFNLPCNKVKLELNKKLKASPINRGSTPSTLKPLFISVKTAESQERRLASQSEHSNTKAQMANKQLQESKTTGLWLDKDEDLDRSRSLSTVLESHKSLDDIKDFVRNSFKAEENAVRIEKLKKAESKNDAASWDPTPKSILKRTGPEEKILCLVAPEDTSDDERLTIIGLVLWEGIEEQLVNSAFDSLFSLFQVENDKKRKSRNDKSSNTCNVVWNINDEMCSLKSTSLEYITKQERLKESCDVIHQLARKVSNSFSQLLGFCQENWWTEATLLSNNSEESSPNADVVEIFCYVPLRCRTSDDSAKSRKDLGIWRVFPGCILSRTDENKDLSQKRTNCGRSRMRVEMQGSTLSTDQDYFIPREESLFASKYDNQSRSQINESRKSRNQFEEKIDQLSENDHCWTDKNSGHSTNKRKRKLQDSEPALKLKIKKINSDDKSPIEADEDDQGTEDDRMERPRQQHYYCVRPRRQKSQRQIEHEQLQQQQKLTRNSNSRSRQRQQRIDENSTIDGRNKSIPKNKEQVGKRVDQESKPTPDEISRSSNADTRNRLTMKLRDKINPRTSYASGVFMALTQGSIYIEISRQNINSTSLTNCSTNQLCLRLQSRQPIRVKDSSETKLSCTISSPTDDFTELSDLVKVEHEYLDSPSSSPAVTPFVKISISEEMLMESVITTSSSVNECSPATSFAVTHSDIGSQELQNCSPGGIQSTTSESNYPLTIMPHKSEISDLPLQPSVSSSDLNDIDDAISFDINIESYAVAPVNCAVTMTTDTLVTKWIKPKLATTGPYPCWD